MLSRTAIDLLVSWKNLHDEALYISFLPKQTQHFFSSLVFEGNSRGGNSDSSPVRIGIISHRLPNGPGSFFFVFFLFAPLFILCCHRRGAVDTFGPHIHSAATIRAFLFPLLHALFLLYMYFFFFFFFLLRVGQQLGRSPPPSGRADR